MPKLEFTFLVCRSMASLSSSDNANNNRYMLEPNNITSEFAVPLPSLTWVSKSLPTITCCLLTVLWEPDVAYDLVVGAGEIRFTEPPNGSADSGTRITDATNYLVNDFVVGQTSGARGEIVAKRYFVDHRFLNAADLLDDNTLFLPKAWRLDDTSKFDGFTYRSW